MAPLFQGSARLVPFFFLSMIARTAHSAPGWCVPPRRNNVRIKPEVRQLWEAGRKQGA